MGGDRLTLLVNIWVHHHPLSVGPLPQRLVKQVCPLPTPFTISASTLLPPSLPSFIRVYISLLHLHVHPTHSLHCSLSASLPFSRPLRLLFHTPLLDFHISPMDICTHRLMFISQSFTPRKLLSQPNGCHSQLSSWADGRFLSTDFGQQSLRLDAFCRGKETSHRDRTGEGEWGPG